MAAFVTRTLDQSLKRGHTRAALGEWWTNRTTLRYGTLTGYHNPRFLASDGLSVWVSNTEGNTVSRVDIKTGALICTLSGIPSPEQIVIVSGFVFVASFQSPGKIYFTTINATAGQPMTELLSGALGNSPIGITYDGQNLWTANGGGSISRFSLASLATSTFTTGFSSPIGILFDGTNLWIPSGDRVSVVRGVGGLAGTVPLGTVLATLTGNGLNGAFQAAFDGERICVTNASAGSVSLWKATDLSPITSVGMSTFLHSRGVCSDGVTFFVGMRDPMGGTGRIRRL